MWIRNGCLSFPDNVQACTEPVLKVPCATPVYWRSVPSKFTAHLRFCGRGIWCMGVNRGKVWRERVGYMTVRVSDATHVHVFGAKKKYVPAVRARQR